jgi:putative colanic acid biosynthesis acetyltransferase WcaF
MSKFELLQKAVGFVGPTFSLGNRIKRAIWKMAWLCCASWTPPFAHRVRIALLRAFGAQVSWKAFVYSSVEIWAPWNLMIDDYGTLGRNVICYNIAPITLGKRAVVSQGAHLCSGSHDFLDPDFPLIARPICIGIRAWVCADAFVGPGISIGDGAILAAAGMAHQDLLPWSIYSGNPAKFLRSRPVIYD